MSLDAITINAVCCELGQVLKDARIDKVRMPSPDEIVLAMRGANGSFKLAISCSGSGAKVYITDEKADNPESPPMFCMLLRKHMIAARLLEIIQPEFERMIIMKFSAYDEFGEISEKSLVIEMTGRSNNVILLSNDNIILGCIRKIDMESCEERPVLPGLLYHMPPRIAKQKLADITPELAKAACAQITDWDCGAKALTSIFDVISPIVGQELIYKSGKNAETLAHELLELSNMINNCAYTPTIIKVDGENKDFTFMKMMHFGTESQCVEMPSFSDAIREFYAEKTAKARQKASTQSILKLMKTVQSRLIKKIANQNCDIINAQNREALKKTADLITANIHSIPKDASEAIVTDYFDEALPQITIKLDSDISPQKNAQKLYREYTRMKNAEENLTVQIANGERELEYVESVLQNLSEAVDDKDVAAINEELLDSGYIRSPSKNRRKKNIAIKPREFTSPSGYRILCGKNNRENDELTLKIATKMDYWFHSHLTPGSHVILFAEGNTPNDSDLEYAASLAACHSKLAGQSIAAIDYALVKHVKKPSGAKPGMVIYTNYKTINVKPAKLEQ